MTEETEVLEEFAYKAPLHREFKRYLAGFWHHAETPGQKAIALFVVIPLMILAMPFVLVFTGLFVVLAWVHGKYERIR